MTRYGMLIDTRKCVGCYGCITSCQRQNDLAPTTQFVHFRDIESGKYPYATVEHVPTQCMHCDDAPCVKACPTGATHVVEGGIVRVDQNKCIGCKYCMVVCPYNAREIIEETGVVDKCRMCAATAKEDEPTCNCVTACLAHARMVGDLDDPNSDISKAIAKYHAKTLTGDKKANIYYVR